jgi:hypothetical protein
MSQVNQVVRSGNKILVKYDNKTIGLVQDIRFTEDYNPTEASGIGNINVQEWVPTMARYQISTRFMLLNKQSMYNAGIAATNAADPSTGVLNGIVFDIEILDSATGKSLRKYVGCSYASGDVEVTKHAVVVTSANFNCLDATGTL